MGKLRIESHAETLVISQGQWGTMLTTAEVEQLIAELAEARSRMQPEVPREFDPNRPMHNHQTTECQPGIEPFSGDLALVFRSTALGWMGFQIPREEARTIWRGYLAKLGSVSPRTGGKN